MTRWQHVAEQKDNETIVTLLGKILAAPLAWIYGGVIDIRHRLFDWGVLKSREFDIPIICVGNITVGGTGKTPHTERLIELLDGEFKVAVLSRGYKRRTKGFVLASTHSSFKKIGDEPKQIKLKYPHIPVAVCEKRVEGIEKLRAAHPEVNLIILDDAFQHRYVEPWVNIVLMDYSRPIYEDHLLPLGRLRDRRSQLNRAQIVIVTKCPEDMKPLDYRIISKHLDLYPYQSLYFTHFLSQPPVPLYPTFGQPAKLPPGTPVVAMAGIANPQPFIEKLQQDYDVVRTFLFKDHYAFKMKDIHALEAALKTLPPQTAVVVTEKDAVRLMKSRKISDEVKRRLYYSAIRVEFLENREADFHRQLDQYVRENQKYNVLHPE